MRVRASSVSASNVIKNSISVLLASTAMVAMPVWAQTDQTADTSEDETADQATETIVVDGIRGTIQSSIEDKRQSAQVFDSLSGALYR